jgi:phosphatidate cytidylyltransferase
MGFIDSIKESRVRIATAVVMLVVVVAVSLIDNYYLWWLFFGSLLIVAQNEMLNLLGAHEYKIPIIALSFLSWILLFFIKPAFFISPLVLIAFVSYLVFIKSDSLKASISFIYPLVPFLFLWQMLSEFGLKSLILLVLVVALTDIGAYYSGKNFGKRKFSPTSPNKTLEGVMGGIIIATIVGFFYAKSIFPTLLALSLTLFISVTSIFGDLFESYLKRAANIKDSGTIFPGHGGVLDRVDGYMFAVVVEYIILKVFS